MTRCRLGSLKRSGIEGLEWILELDVEYVGCKSARNFDLHLSSGGSLPQPQQWTSVPVIRIGSEYKWIDPS